MVPGHLDAQGVEEQDEEDKGHNHYRQNDGLPDHREKRRQESDDRHDHRHE